MTNIQPHWKFIARKVLYTLSIAVSILLVISISFYDLPHASASNQSLNAQIQYWICVYFLIDFCLLMMLTDKKWNFLSHNYILILISIPYTALFNHFGVNFSNEALYILKFLPTIRGAVAILVLAKMAIRNKINSLFVSYLAIFFSMAYLQTLLFYTFEMNVNPKVTSYFDALWWASMTVTTLGSNIIPITTMGKVSTAILAVIGMTIFPIFTVYATSIIQQITKSQQQRAQELKEQQLSLHRSGTRKARSIDKEQDNNKPEVHAPDTEQK